MDSFTIAIGTERNILLYKFCHAVPIAIGIVSASKHGLNNFFSFKYVKASIS